MGFSDLGKVNSSGTLSASGGFASLGKTPNVSPVQIQPQNAYIEDSLSQAKSFMSDPIGSIVRATKTGLDSIGNTFGTAYESSKTALKSLMSNASAAQKTADTLHALGSDAAILFSPITGAFAAAEQLPVLKQAADVLNLPFAVTGKIGDFAAEKFVDVLPIDQQSKDILKPAFGEVGALAGQILLGGKIVSMVAKGIKPDKIAIDKAVADTKLETQTAKQQAVANRQAVQPVQPETPIAKTETPAIPKDFEPLAAEARKYKSAEDFIQSIRLKALEKSPRYATDLQNIRAELAKLPENKMANEAVDLLHKYKSGGWFDVAKDFYTKATQAVGKSIPKELQPLAKEAQKYKSAEEFVNNKEVYYRGTTAPQTGEIKPADTYGLAYGKGVYLASDARFAKDYGPNVSKYYVDWKNPFVMDKPIPNEIIDRINKDFTPKQLGKKLEYGTKGEDVLGELPLNADEANDYLQKLGFDGLKDASTGYNKQSVIFDTSILKTKSQLTDIWNKAVGEVSKPQEITGNKPSGVAKSIEAKAIEQGLINKGFDKLAGYDFSTIKEQAQIFTDTINNKGIDEARAMLRGEKPLAEGQRSSSFIVGMEEYLKQHPDPELVYELANSPHTSAFSQAGSELGLGQNRVQDSFTAKVEEIKKAREVRTKITPETRTKIKVRAKEAMEKINLSEAELGKLEKFINENLC